VSGRAFSFQAAAAARSGYHFSTEQFEMKHQQQWASTAMRMFFDKDRPLAEIFVVMQPLGVTPAVIVGEIKDQLTARCANRGELVAQHLRGVIIEIDHEMTITRQSSPDVKKDSLQRRIEFVNLLKAALARS
jgi:hypothetical protein